MPKVSVILTSFNHAKFLREAIDSVLAQTFEDFELIIWDDASSDDSWNIINSYADLRIKAYRNDETRRGIYGINKAIMEIASGDYIAIHHSDDIWEAEKLEKQLKYLEGHSECGAVFTNALAIGEDGEPLNDPGHFYSNIFDQPNRTRQQWLNHFFYYGNALCHPSVLIKKLCYKDCGLYRYGLGQVADFDMWMRLCLKYNIHVLPEKLVRFRVRANEANSSGNRPETRIRGMTEFHNLLKNYLRIRTFKEMVDIFPEAKKYYRKDGFEPKFVLAMVALGDNTLHWAKFFGIELLFDLIGDEKKAKEIKSLYGFDYRDFIALTERYDVFSLEAVAERDRQITGFNQVLAERDGQIASLNQSVAERDWQIASLNQSVAERDWQITSLNQSVAERDWRIASLNQAVAERDGQVSSLKKSVVEYERHIIAIYNSKSWRLTGPIRFVRRLAGSICCPLPKNFIRNGFSAVRGVIRRYGLTGFVRRMPYYLRDYRTYLAFLSSQHPITDGDLFSSSPWVPRDIRLHPELAGVGEPLDVSVSIIIPTLNAGTEFCLLLRKLNMQCGFREIEIVIVDSGSDDGTVELAHDIGCTVVEIAPTDFTHSYARNIGADAARGDYLLFMVQDAYPIGDYWVYGMLSYLLDYNADKLAAVSCAEYSRSDSDMMYDSLIHTHYRFLGCLEYDRIGEYRGDDHMSLRAYGQLSDVSCLISRETFNCYLYQGDYAEDLDLGIRLIKDGYRVAMLASVKVVHSHNRPSYYYLKRSFVDVIFLVEMFEDFVYPRIESMLGLISGIVSTAAHLSGWLAGFDEYSSDRVLHEELSEWIREWRYSCVELRIEESSNLGDKQLDIFIDSLAKHYILHDKLNVDVLNESHRFLDNYLARLEHFNNFAGHVYAAQDVVLRCQLREAVVKTFAATAGSMLGFMYIDFSKYEGAEREMAESIYSELKRGI